MITRYRLDPANVAQFSAEQNEHHARLSDENIQALAVADADNPPLSPDELMLIKSVQLVRQARMSTNLSQTRFAREFKINLSRLRDLEQGRTTADSALAAYLTVILNEPEAVLRAFKAA